MVKSGMSMSFICCQSSGKLKDMTVCLQHQKRPNMNTCFRSLLNTMGGDVESGLAIAEMIASMSKPTVSLVLGGSHSIGVPLAVSTDYSLIVPSGTMVIHPVRMSGTVIGARQTYDYFQQMQDRIIGFITSHCTVTSQQVEKMMMNTQMLTKDLGTILVGKQAVDLGIIDAVGGISDAFSKLYQLIDAKK